MAEIKVVDFNQPDAAETFATSLKHTGFGVIKNHPIDQCLIQQCYADWHDFFNSTDKHQYKFNRETHSGYVCPKLSETAKGHQHKDLKEFFHFYVGSPCPEALRAPTVQLMQQLQQMASTLLSWINDYLPLNVAQQLSMPLPQMMRGSVHNLLRILHYPPLTGHEPEGAVRAAAHEDINLITLLPAATAEGLQAQDAQGHWMDVPIESDWIIINSGDMLQECTDGFYPSTTHRVLNPVGESANKSRLSMPFFLHPEASVRLSARYTADSYRRQRYAELGLD